MAVHRVLLSDCALDIGRGRPAGLVAADRPVSSHHATVEFRDGAFHVVHRSQSNPTLVNGRPVGLPHRLQHGDHIRVSEGTALRFVDSRLVP